MYRSHFQTGLLFGLAGATGLALVGQPLPVEQAIALPVLCGYLSAIPDVDHPDARIRHAVPPARWLFLLARLVVRLCGGRVDYWTGHRRVTHTIDFAVWLGLAAALPVWWLGWWWWIGPAVTMGCLAHRFGDRLTVSGVPAWSWRLDQRRGWKVRTGKGSPSEGLFAVVQGAACLGLCWVLVGA